MNNFFASVELLERPDLVHLPVIVGGDESSRRGVVLAKNEIAKQLGIRTAETVFSARKKAPNLVSLPPQFERYQEYSEKAKAIYARFTPYVESFGLDECWLKLESGDGEELAYTIKEAVKEELKLTVSIGVSFTKIFAKLGSDYKKPDAVTVITRDNYQQMLWPLPVTALLYVGKVTAEKLSKIGIKEIGQLAKTDVRFLERLLGKQGRLLWNEANGHGEDEVALASEERQPKSIGNSITLARDATTIGEISGPLRWLAESVANRLAERELMGYCVQLMVKDQNFKTSTRQTTLNEPVTKKQDIFEHVMQLFVQHFDFSIPFRGLGVSVSEFGTSELPQQITFDDIARQQKRIDLQQKIAEINERYGDVTRIGQ